MGGDFMVITFGFNGVAWSEINHPRQRIRLFLQFTQWAFHRWRSHMINLIAAVLFFFQMPPLPGIGELFDRGVTFAFAILFWYSLTSSNKDHREDLRKLHDIHEASLEKLYDEAKRREEKLTEVLERNATHIERLTDATDRITKEKFCPLQTKG